MPVRIFLTVLLFIVVASSAAAMEVAVVKSFNAKPFDDAVAGIRQAFPGKVKVFSLPDLASVDVLRVVRDSHPDVAIAVGAEALQKLRRLYDIPVVYLMVLTPEKIVPPRDGITGVSLVAPPQKQFSFMQRLLPGMRRVGIVYSPSTAALARRYSAAAREAGVEAVVREVQSSRNVPQAVVSIGKSVDAFWMIPDPAIYTPEAVEFLLLYSHDNSIPIITFSAKYVEMGALGAAETDPAEQGRLAGELARREAASDELHPDAHLEARTILTAINRNVARKMKIQIPDDVAARARMIQ